MAYRRLPIDPSDLISMYLSGESLLGIQKHTSISRDTVKRYLLKTGVPLRSQSEQEQIKWARMTVSQRANQVVAAHNAARGRVATEAERCAHALTLQQNRTGSSSPAERVLQEMVKRRGLECLWHQAIGRYLCDLTVGTVAVEVFGGNFHFFGRHAARAERRFKYLRDRGWDVFIVVVDGRYHPLTGRAADDLVAFAKRPGYFPPIRGQYRMIWGDGNLIAEGSLHGDYETFIQTLRHAPSHRRA